MTIEQQVLVHRFLYYVLDDPVISDFEYDRLECRARSILPLESPVHGVGSSLRSSYPAEIEALALSMR